MSNQALLWIGFNVFVVGMLILDLGVFHRKAHVVKIKEALLWSAVWIALALTFNLGIYIWQGERAALEFLTGYMIEKSLSVDNIFVFVMVFSYFAIPAKYQHQVLFYGILGAIVFRAIFVAMGAALMRYHAVIVFFGLFLIFTGIKIVVVKEKPPDPGRNLLVRLLRRAFPVTKVRHGPKFFARENNRYHITPLLIALAFLEATDIVFAVDSVPAIFGFTREPLLVFT